MGNIKNSAILQSPIVGTYLRFQNVCLTLKIKDMPQGTCLRKKKWGL